MKLLKTLLLTGVALMVAGNCLRADTLDDATKAHADGNLATALSLYQEVAKQGSPAEVRTALYGIAGCLFSQKNYDDAYNAFVSFSKQYPTGYDSILAVVMAGNVRVEQGRPDDGKPLFDQALSRDQNGANSSLWVSWANLGEGRVLTADKNYQAAVPYLLKAIKGASEPRVVDIAMQCMRVCDGGLRDEGHIKQAQEWLGESQLDAGRWLVDYKDYVVSETPLKDACTNLTEPGSLGEAQTLLANMYYLTSNEKAKWMNTLSMASAAEQTLKRDPRANQRFAGLLGRAYMYQAWALFDLEQFQQSIDKCKAVRSELHSADYAQLVDSYNCESVDLFTLKQYSAEIALLNKSRAMFHDDGSWRARAGSTIGNAYFIQEDYRKAVSSLKQFIADADAQPCDQNDKDRLRFLLAQVFMKTGDISGAKAQFAKIVSESTGWFAPMAKAELDHLNEPSPGKQNP